MKLTEANIPEPPRVFYRHEVMRTEGVFYSPSLPDVAFISSGLTVVPAVSEFGETSTMIQVILSTLEMYFTRWYADKHDTVKWYLLPGELNVSFKNDM